MSAVREALEALGHTLGALPEPRLLTSLYVRFQAQVPLRRAAEARPAEELLRAWLDDGEGCCGEGRVRAFAALAQEAGFALAVALARGPDGAARHVLLADGRRLLFDPAFPLPAPLSLDPPAEAEKTGYGVLSARTASVGGVEVLLETRGEERVLFRVEPENLAKETVSPAITGAEPLNVASAPESAINTSPVQLFRLLDDRLLTWTDGVLQVSDVWSRLRSPFPAADADGLAALFGPPIPPWVASNDGPAPIPEPTLAVYHASTAGPKELRDALADPAVHAALLPEGWSVENLSLHAAGFQRNLVEDGVLLRTERITLLPDGVVVESEGPLALFRRRTWRLEPRSEGTRLRLLATLADSVPPRGLPEGTRRRLVFELASELLALDAHVAAG